MPTPRKPQIDSSPAMSSQGSMRARIAVSMADAAVDHADQTRGSSGNFLGTTRQGWGQGFESLRAHHFPACRVSVSTLCPHNARRGAPEQLAGVLTRAGCLPAVLAHRCGSPPGVGPQEHSRAVPYAVELGVRAPLLSNSPSRASRRFESLEVRSESAFRSMTSSARADPLPECAPEVAVRPRARSSDPVPEYDH